MSSLVREVKRRSVRLAADLVIVLGVAVIAVVMVTIYILAH